MSVSVLAIARDEDHILPEWIQHTLGSGIRHIYLFDDQSVNRIQAQHGVTVFRIETDFYQRDEFCRDPLYDADLYREFVHNKQLYFYNVFLRRFRASLTEWLLCIDIDEFLWLSEDYPSVSAFLEEHARYDRIFVPWLMFGTSFFIDMPEGAVRENFVHHDDHYHEYGKCFFRPDRYPLISCGHFITTETDNALVLPHGGAPYSLPVHLDHYITLSARKYLERKSRPNIGQPRGKKRLFRYYVEVLHSYNRTADKELYVLTSNDEPVLGRLDAEPSQILATRLSYRDASIQELRTAGILPDDFDPGLYARLNPDLASTLQPLLLHFIIHFPYETRAYRLDLPEDFSIAGYREYNPDLAFMGDLEISKHYCLYGRQEKRVYRVVLPETFRLSVYRENNPDLIHMDDAMLRLHFYQHGQHEKRVYR